MKKQLHIFIAFFRSGILGFGGGPTTIPLVHKEDRKKLTFNFYLSSRRIHIRFIKLWLKTKK